MDHGHGWSACNNDHVLVVCDHVDDGIRLSGFILAGFMASKNADLLYFGGPWADYQCHSETTSNQPHYQFEVQLLGLGPYGFPSFFGFRCPVRSFVPCIANNEYRYTPR